MANPESLQIVPEKLPHQDQLAHINKAATQLIQVIKSMSEITSFRFQIISSQYKLLQTHYENYQNKPKITKLIEYIFDSLSPTRQDKQLRDRTEDTLRSIDYYLKQLKIIDTYPKNYHLN